jgi:glycosyltransferase involved in cell wall biosynthesis
MASVPMLSVLMPVYNAERYVAEAVDSILGQTFRDFEFLIIDDGSTDSSGAILRRYAERDPRIRVVSRHNTGLLVALNELLGLARGELLARMDADDVALPDRLEREVNYLRDHPEVVCVGGRVMLIDPDGHPLGPGHLETDHEELVEMGLSGLCPLNHPSVLMRREVVLAVGGYRPEYSTAEDLDLFLRLAEVGRLANLPVIVTRYRLHPNSVSERQQRLQIAKSRAVAAEASARLGLPDRFVERQPWRPSDRASRLNFATWFGWAAYKRRDRRGAVRYGLKAVAAVPWKQDGWRLLACALLKRPRTEPEAPVTEVNPETNSTSPRAAATTLGPAVNPAPGPDQAPTLSVLMPAYNAGRFIDQAIESVLAQSFSDFEFIIVDDGSTDDTRAIIERYAARDPRIRLFSRPNTGLVGARNDTLAPARGEFLAFLDADDVALPGRFERQVSYLQAHPEYVLVASRVIIIDPDGDPLRIMGEALGHEDLERGLLGARGQLLYNSSVTARQQAVLAVGGYMPDTDPAEDLDLFLRLAEVGRMVVLDEPLTMYRESLNKVGHTQCRRQGEAYRDILVEAHRRRGLEPPDAVRRVSFSAIGPADRHAIWAWWALGAGHVATARKHAVASLAEAPFSIDSWHLMFCALRGH